MSRDVYLVIPANGRHQMITELLVAIGLPADHVILIDNGAYPPLNDTHAGLATVVDDRLSPMNIQRWWNLGWRVAGALATGPYAVAFLNSDAMTDGATLTAMAAAIDEHNASVVGIDHCGILSPGQIYRKETPGPGDWEHRLYGWGFVARGELETRFDERFEWWYGDDDFDWSARAEFGGTIILGGTRIDNRDPDGAQREHPELHEQTKKDRITFINKWGTDTHV